MQEVWKAVVGGGGYYEVSNLGRVKSLARNLIKKDAILKGYDRAGYVSVEIRVEGAGRAKRIHRLVAEAFLPNPEHKPYVNHINGIKDDNRLSNLEWCTQKENVKHAIDTGLFKFKNNGGPSKGVDKLSLEGVLLESYPSQAEAIRQNNLSGNHISAVCKGLRNQTGGFLWRFSSEKGEI